MDWRILRTFGNFANVLVGSLENISVEVLEDNLLVLHTANKTKCIQQIAYSTYTLLHASEKLDT